MDDKERQTAAEAAAWEGFEAAVAAVSRDRLEEPVLTDGWSVKDVLWHIAWWWEDCADTLESLHVGIHTEWDGDTDDQNARILAQGRALSLEDVELRSAHIRERMLLAWDKAPADDPRAPTAFRAETVEHYDEHLEQIRSISG
jgi:Mycothiol maleylpyruvate isomerase N-terminal domain